MSSTGRSSEARSARAAEAPPSASCSAFGRAARCPDGPIGVFDSGYGGLTVLAEIASRLPHESTVFVGDSAHFPYGPKSRSEVKGYVLGICDYLVRRGCKLVVIACNTATAAGLKDAQKAFDVPVVGVVEPGARAAVHMTRNRRVGVIATKGTVDADAYPAAIWNLDAGVEVFSVAAPKFVDIAEAGLQFRAMPQCEGGPAAHGPSAAWGAGAGCEAPGGRPDTMIVSDRGVLDADSSELYLDIAEGYLGSLREAGIDTLVLGCTHFPLIQPLVQNVVGKGVSLVSSAEETAREVADLLDRRGQLAPESATVEREFLTTGENTAEFERFGRIVMGEALGPVGHADVWDSRGTMEGTTA